MIFQWLIFFSSLVYAAQDSSSTKLLSELVSISSSTDDVDGVNEVQERVSNELKRLGMSVKLIPNPKSDFKSGDLLVAERKGQESRFLTLVGHADTVFETLNPFEISTTQKIIKGSGVADNKGGLVVGISTLKRLFADNGQTRFSIRLIVSPSEETGSRGFHELFQKYAKDSVFMFGLEPARESGNIVTSRKGAKWFHIQVSGKEAHAGVDHASGVNACQELALILTKLSKLTDYTGGTTVNIGRIEGGKNKFNIVCGFAEAKIDTRFSTPGNEKKLSRQIEKILSDSKVESPKSHEKTKITFTVPERAPPLAPSSEARPYIQKYIQWIRDIEKRQIIGEATGGVADLNTMARDGLPMMDGLGPVGGGFHTNDEYIEAESLDTRAQALEKLLREADRLIK